MSKLSRNNELAEAVGARIKHIRQWHGMSQAAFAKELDIGRSAVANYEQGRQIPDTMILLQLHQRFGVTTDWLLTGSTAGMTQAFIHEFFGPTYSGSGPPIKNGTE